MLNLYETLDLLIDEASTMRNYWRKKKLEFIKDEIIKKIDVTYEEVK